MKILVSEKISPHRYKTSEGYLVCTDAILARTGKQTYLSDEIFHDGNEQEVEVDRPYKEVFDEKTLASFENKPITIEHPDESVNVGNYKDYAVGYVRDIHQGKTDNGEDVILGNLVIVDQNAINDIESGTKTDLSCGYDCDIVKTKDGYSQVAIRGNHLALCEEGRAGIAHIQDSKIRDEKLEVGKTYTSRLGNKLTINKIDVGYSDYDGTPVITIHYSYQTKDGKRGTSTCSTESFFNMMRDKFVDSRVDDKNTKTTNDAFNNGKLKDFKIEDLIRLVKKRSEAVNSIRLDDDGNTYFITVGGFLNIDLNTGKGAYLDVVYENKDSALQKRCLMISKASSWKKIITAFNNWKNTLRNINDSKVKDDFSRQIKLAISRGKLIIHPYNGKYAMRVKKSDFESLKKELEKLQYKNIRFENNPYTSYNVFFTDSANDTWSKRVDEFMEHFGAAESSIKVIIAKMKKFGYSDVAKDETKLRKYLKRHWDYLGDSLTKNKALRLVTKVKDYQIKH